MVLAELRPEEDCAAFGREVLSGLSRAQKSIACTWLYDHRGSELFEEITDLEEYYPTRTEIRILEQRLPRFGARLPEHASVIEIGAGASRKTRLLLRALAHPEAYVPIDISAEFMSDALRSLHAEFPALRCEPLALDFTHADALRAAARHLDPDGPRIGFFPGSTIGNFNPEEATRFLRLFGDALGAHAFLVIGVDATLDPKILLPAYDDAKGVTAAFNLNLLVRINRELGGTFRLADFRHEARFDAQESRIEMHLVSLIEQRVQVSGTTFHFRANESIHTENSYKYSSSHFSALARAAGWSEREVWRDSAASFEVHLLERDPASPPG